jgi:hypothetical protein
VAWLGLDHHGLSQYHHGFLVRFAEQRESVYVDQLIVGTQATVSGRGATVYHCLDEDA